jgi:hypothetical protein
MIEILGVAVVSGEGLVALRGCPLPCGGITGIRR